MYDNHRDAHHKLGNLHRLHWLVKRFIGEEMIVGYARVSSKDQNLDRQIAAQQLILDYFA